MSVRQILNVGFVVLWVSLASLVIYDMHMSAGNETLAYMWAGGGVAVSLNVITHMCCSEEAA